MGFMASGGYSCEYRNASHWLDHNYPSFTIPNFSENNNWETADVFMSVDKNVIRNATGRVDAPLECCGCTNSPRYHVERFHTYRNCPNKMELDVTEFAKRLIQ